MGHAWWAQCNQLQGSLNGEKGSGRVRTTEMQHEKTGPAIAGFEGEKGLGAQESRQWEKQENRVSPKPSRKKFSLADYLTY